VLIVPCLRCRVHGAVVTAPRLRPRGPRLPDQCGLACSGMPAVSSPCLLAYRLVGPGMAG